MSILGTVINDLLTEIDDDRHEHYKKARSIVQSLYNTTKPNEIIERISKEIGVSLGTAKTYFYNARKELFGKYVPKGDDEQDSSGSQQHKDDEESPDAKTSDKEFDLEQDDDYDLEDSLDEPEDPNKQGIIRTVDGAHLVYKRQTEDGTYEELWIYNIDNTLSTELEIKQAILAGTDIPSNKTESEDGYQSYTLTTLGNAQLLHLSGMPN